MMKVTASVANKLLLMSPQPRTGSSRSISRDRPPHTHPHLTSRPPPAGTPPAFITAVQLFRSSGPGSHSLHIMQNVSGRVGCKKRQNNISQSPGKRNKRRMERSFVLGASHSSKVFFLSESSSGLRCSFSIFKVKYRKCKRLWSVFDSLFNSCLFSSSLSCAVCER